MGFIVPNNILEAEYLTVLRYATRGNNQKDAASRRIKDGIKNWSLIDFDKALEQVVSQIEVTDFFGETPTFVPIPSSKLSKPNTLHVPLEICNELKKIYPSEVSNCLTRHIPIEKSSQHFNKDERPTVSRHLESISLNSALIYTDNIILVDDVLTRGTTSIACAKILNDRYPNKRIAVFALLRPTHELANDVPNFRHIEKGKITLFNTMKCYIKEHSNMTDNPFDLFDFM